MPLRMGCITDEDMEHMNSTTTNRTGSHQGEQITQGHAQESAEGNTNGNYPHGSVDESSTAQEHSLERKMGKIGLRE